MYERDNIVVVLIVFIFSVVWSQFYECHQDGGLDLEEGPITDLRFTWLGVLQYIHIKNGTPHYCRVPRLVLIAKQFVLSTAHDASVIPQGYALGNAVFGDYERDEQECKVTVEQLSVGASCDPAVLVMPIADVLLHPEYKNFGTKKSIALLKLLASISSDYVVPVCLPFKNFLINKKTKKLTTEKLFYIDFAADVPRDYADEDKEVQKLSLLPRELCVLYDYPITKRTKQRNSFMRDRLACSTGCGLHSGAPSLVHEHTGHWSLVSLALGGSSCPDPLRPRRPPPPPAHILIFPYVHWITAAITGKAFGAFLTDDPFGYLMHKRASAYDYLGQAWVGHWWMGGLRCYDRGSSADDLFKFYEEMFQVTPLAESVYLNYFLELAAPTGYTAICVKIGMPYRYGKPTVEDLDTPKVKVTIPTIRFLHPYRFQVEAWAYNSSQSQSDSSASTSCSTEDVCPFEHGVDFLEGDANSQEGGERKGEIGTDTTTDLKDDYNLTAILRMPFA